MLLSYLEWGRVDVACLPGIIMVHSSQCGGLGASQQHLTTLMQKEFEREGGTRAPLCAPPNVCWPFHVFVGESFPKST